MTALAENQSVSVGPTESNRLGLSSEWVTTDEVRVVVSGEIDMSNTDIFVMEVLSVAGEARCVVLDLCGVGFFGTAGCSALLEIDACLRRMNTQWTVKPGRIVARTLEICGLLTTLPISPSERLPRSSEPTAEAR